ncbi:histidine kinase [Saccharicrinis aurantiacus]|uniref:histidine kinase n=1 Tax=Saccharicrinis aurantiacus TaxID=1849719 RepID=UPI00249265B5|nr:histidine kinase [Saccharicrinis aurantiacus]
MQKHLILSLIFSIGFINLLAKENTPDSAYLSFQSRIIESDGLELSMAKAHYDYGVYLDDNNLVDTAIYHLKIALKIASSIPDDTIISKTANYLGSIYWVEGDCNKSTAYYNQALSAAERDNLLDMISIIKMNLSGNLNSAGENEKAIQYALEALSYKESVNKIEGICYDYVMVGEIFQRIDNIDKWEMYITKAYQLRNVESCASVSDLVMVYNNMGQIAEAKKEYKKALAYYDTIVQVSKPVAYNQGIGISLLNSALIYQTLEKPSKALDLASESESYLGDVPYFVMAINNVKIEQLISLSRYEEALSLARENINNEHIYLYPVLKQDCFALLYEINYALKDYAKAYTWNDSLRNYETKILEEQNKQNIEELETKYQTEKKEQQIELLSAENQIKTQRSILFIALSVSLLLTLLLGVLIYFRYRRENHQKQETLRQQLLRSQMNPHFLFNALGSIQNYMINNDTKKAAGYLNNFAGLTRAILQHSEAETIMLDEEITALHNYIKLEQMRLNNSFDYSIDYDTDLETEFIKIPPMLVQPFVENAIKHGLRNLQVRGKLTIRFTDKTETLEVNIIDNGTGFDENSVKSNNHKSMAMSIFNKRIQLLNKALGKKASIQIKSTRGSGTTITINIPIIE